MMRGMERPQLRDLTADEYRQQATASLMHMLSAKAQAASVHGDARALYERLWGTTPLAPRVLETFAWEQKAAVAPGTTTDATWAAPLVQTRLMDGFLPRLRQASVLGQPARARPAR